MTISFDIQKRESGANLDLLVKNLHPAMFSRVLAPEMEKASIRLTHYIRSRHLEGGTTPSRLKIRSKNLYDSVKTLPTVAGFSTITGGISIGEDLAYTRVHIGNNRSTTIKARGKALTIPLGPALDSRGLKIQSARMYSDLVLIPRRGYALLAKRLPDNHILPYFLLKKSVKVPMRVNPQNVLYDNMPLIKADFEMAITKYFNR